MSEHRSFFRVYLQARNCNACGSKWSKAGRERVLEARYTLEVFGALRPNSVNLDELSHKLQIPTVSFTVSAARDLRQELRDQVRSALVVA